MTGAVALRAQHPRVAETVEQNGRVTFLLANLADQARLSDDLAFAARAQSQAATLLWPYDRERARAIFRRAFQSLAPSLSLKAGETNASNGEVTRPSRSDMTVSERQQLRAELLNHIAGCDPELAEDLARALVYSLDAAKESNGSPVAGASEASPFLPVSISSRNEVERREVLIGVALRVVEREPHRAMTLGQLSLAMGISPNFARLLILMRAADRGLADLLFSSAVGYLERSRTADLSDIHTLGSYLISPSASPVEGSMNRSVIVRFLKLTFEEVMRRSKPAVIQADLSFNDRAAIADQSAAAYFIGRQLSGLFAGYLPDRLAELQRKVAELSEESAPEKVVDLSQVEAQTSDPSDIVYEARISSDEDERDSLYARAALAWLNKGEMNEAQAAASQITGLEIRDRVLTRIARRQALEGRIDDAVFVARRIGEVTARAGMLVRLADSALVSRDRVRATELLNEAEKEIAKARPSIARSQSLLTIASSFSAFDTLRAFEVMQTAVKSINGLFNLQESPAPPEQPFILQANPAPAVSSDEIYNLDFEGTLAVLAQVDFDRALLLAQQLDIKDASVIAQLAVCQGGLTVRPAGEHSAESEEDASRL